MEPQSIEIKKSKKSNKGKLLDEKVEELQQIDQAHLGI